MRLWRRRSIQPAGKSGTWVTQSLPAHKCLFIYLPHKTTWHFLYGVMDSLWIFRPQSCGIEDRLWFCWTHRLSPEWLKFKINLTISQANQDQLIKTSMFDRQLNRWQKNRDIYGRAQTGYLNGGWISEYLLMTDRWQLAIPYLQCKIAWREGPTLLWKVDWSCSKEHYNSAELQVDVFPRSRSIKKEWPAQ